MKVFDEAWLYVIILMDDLCRAGFRDKNCRAVCVFHGHIHVFFLSYLLLLINICMQVQQACDCRVVVTHGKEHSCYVKKAARLKA